MASVKEETEESKNQEEDKDLADGGNTNYAVEHDVKVEAEEEGVKEQNREKEGEIEKVEENVEGEEQEKGNVKEEEGKSVEEDDKKREKKSSRKVKRGADKAELASPRTPGIERPSRERKTVERFTVNVTARGTPVTKPMAIEKGRGSLLKDIPNVAFKLSKRKGDENLQLLHTDTLLADKDKKKKRKSKESASKTSNSADVAVDKSKKRASQGKSWDLYLQKNRRPDGSFVDKRSRLVHQSIEALRDEFLIPLDDGTISDQPSSEEVNSMFKHVVGGRKNVRMYGCGSMASTIFSDEMTPCSRGGGSGSSSQDSHFIREEIKKHNKIIEFLRVDLQALQSTQEELRSRISTAEDQIRFLVYGMSQVPPTQRHTKETGRRLHGRDNSSRGRLTAHPARLDPHAASSSSVDRFRPASSRPDVRDKVLQVASTYDLTSPVSHRFSNKWSDPSHEFGDEDGDGDDDDDETQSS